MLDPDDLSPPELAAMITKNLRLGNRVSPTMAPNLNGRQSAAQELFALATTSSETGSPVAGHRGPSRTTYPPVPSYRGDARSEQFVNSTQQKEQSYELA